MPLTVKTAVLHEENQSKNQCKVLTFFYYVEKITYSIPTTFIAMTYATSIPTTVVGTDIPTKLYETAYFDKSCTQDTAT